MGRKTIDNPVFIPPVTSEVVAMVEKLGGNAKVARLLRKAKSTISAWCKGTAKIDYANWKLLVEEGLSEKEKFFKSLENFGCTDDGQFFEQMDLGFK